MPITYVGGKVGGSAGQGGGAQSITSGLTGGSGSSAAAGDLCVVTVSVGTQARAPTISISTPSGFTALTAQRTTTTTYDTNVQTCYKILTAGDITTGSVTIPASGNNADGIAWAIQVFRGVDATTPMDTTAQYATGTATALVDPAAITPVTQGAWIVVCGGGAAATAANYTAAYLTNLLTTALGVDTNDALLGVGYYTGWTSGSYNPAAFGGGSNTANDSWGATTLALRPDNPKPLVGALTLTGVAPTVVRTQDVTLALSDNIASSAATSTTYQLTPPTGKTGAADFSAGKISDDTNGITLDLALGKYTEFEWAVKLGPGATGLYEFQVLFGSTAPDYSVIPTVSGGTSITPSTGSVSLTGGTPTRNQTFNLFRTPSTGSIKLDTPDRKITPPPGRLHFGHQLRGMVGSVLNNGAAYSTYNAQGGNVWLFQETVGTGQHSMTSPLWDADFPAVWYRVKVKNNSGTRNLKIFVGAFNVGYYGYFDVDAGQVVSSGWVGGALGSASIGPVDADGYRLCTVVFSPLYQYTHNSYGYADISTTNYYVDHNLVLDQTTTTVYAGDGTSGLLLKEPRFEAHAGWQPTVAINSTTYFIPSTGSAALTGAAPTVKQTFKIAGLVGALALTGYAPTPKINYKRNPLVGAANFTFIAPVARVASKAYPSTASLTLTGGTPTIRRAFRIAATLGSLSLTGYAPTPKTNYKRNPLVGAATFTFIAPTTRTAFKITPNVGGLTTTGIAPNTRTGFRQFPQTTALAITGYAPSLRRTFRVTPTLGSLTLAGVAPSLWRTFKITPTVGALTLTGYAIKPLSINLQPLRAQLTLTGGTPTLRSTFKITPSLGSLTLAGVAPRLSTRIRPNAGALTLTGTSSVQRVRTTTFLGSLTLTGTVSRLNTRIRPSTGSLTQTGIAPSLRSAFRITPTKVSLTLTGVAPTARGAYKLVPSVTALTLAGIAPKLSTRIRPNTGTLTLTGTSSVQRVRATLFTGSLALTGYAPKPLSINLQPSRGQLALTGGTPTLRFAFKQTPLRGQLTVTGQQPVVRENNPEYPLLNNLVLFGYSPVLRTAFKAAPLKASLALTGYAPLFRWGARPQTAAVTLTGIAPSLRGAYKIVPSTGSATLTGVAPRLNTRIRPSAGSASLTAYAVTTRVRTAGFVGALTLTGIAPSLRSAFKIAPSVGGAALTGYAPSLKSTFKITPVLGSLALSGLAPTARMALRVVPSTGALATTGYSVTLRTRIAPSVGTLALTGYAAQKALSSTATQHSFRWRNDNGDETTATWAQALNTDHSVQANVTVRLRTLITTTGDLDPSQFQLEYRKVGDTEWKKVA